MIQKLKVSFTTQLDSYHPGGGGVLVTLGYTDMCPSSWVYFLLENFEAGIHI